PRPRAGAGPRRRAAGRSCGATRPSTATPRGCRAGPAPTTARTLRGAPPAPRPPPCRSARTGAPTRRGPAARARATGPRSWVSGSFVVRRLVHQGTDLDLADPGERHPGRDFERPLEAVDVDDVEAAEVLLGFEVGT